jgi:hypothetical protein
VVDVDFWLFKEFIPVHSVIFVNIRTAKVPTLKAGLAEPKAAFLTQTVSRGFVPKDIHETPAVHLTHTASHGHT